MRFKDWMEVLYCLYEEILQRLHSTSYIWVNSSFLWVLDYLLQFRCTLNSRLCKNKKKIKKSTRNYLIKTNSYSCMDIIRIYMCIIYVQDANITKCIQLSNDLAWVSLILLPKENKMDRRKWKLNQGDSNKYKIWSTCQITIRERSRGSLMVGVSKSMIIKPIIASAAF